MGSGVGVGLILTVLLLLWWAGTHGKRNNRAAPKDASQPFCILFTDIQGSTSLWATIPDVMAGALDSHHTLIRRLIAKHGCYEVKTIGDSFMCATKCPAQALRFALALQEKLADHDWGTDRIDRVYRQTESADSEVHGFWNGLRVRVGIHFGHGDIKLDPVSHGYDYYGTVVNTAARIESACHGGQIGVSEAVYAALGGHFTGSLWTDLGLQPLRGLAEPLRLYQVLPEGLLSTRQFPPLRIDQMDGKEEALQAVGNGPSSPALSSNCSEHGVPFARWVETHALVVKGDISVEDLRRHYHVLHVGLSTLLSPLAYAAKQDVVGQLCAHLHVPNHGVDVSQLPRTLQGLIKRVVPATVYQRLERHSSHSSGMCSTYAASPKTTHFSPKMTHFSPKALGNMILTRTAQRIWPNSP